MLKFGNEEQRKLIATELKGRFVELSQSLYGRFITLRLLKYTYDSIVSSKKRSAHLFSPVLIFTRSFVLGILHVGHQLGRAS
jgi:hypothetical protein